MNRWTMAALASLVVAGSLPAVAQAPEGEPAATAKPAPKKAAARKPPAKAPEPSTPMAVQAGRQPLPPPNLTVLCEGIPARYAAETGVSIWVARSGLISVENPLRPLTPETMRVLQVVVGDRSATAYGPDLAGLRRGGTPSALQAILGGTIAWDDALTLLPDTLVIVSEANETMARLPFRECSAAPAVKVEPPKPQAKTRRPVRPEGEAAARKALPKGPALPKGLALPQGAIPEKP